MATVSVFESESLSNLPTGLILKYYDRLSALERIYFLVDEWDVPFFRKSAPNAEVVGFQTGGEYPARTLDFRMRALQMVSGAEGRTAFGINFFSAGIFGYIAQAVDIFTEINDNVPTRRIYIVCSPRSGSTFLTDLLTRAGVGAPSEHYKVWFAIYLNKVKLSLKFSFDEIAKYAAVKSGIFCTKLIIDDLFEYLRYFRSDVFAELRHYNNYILTRSDKSAQAYSNLRSHKLDLWHVLENDDKASALRDIRFSADFWEVFIKERALARQEADCLEEFEAAGLAPKLLAYEALAQSRQAARCVIHEIARGAGLSKPTIEGWPELIRIGQAVDGAGLAIYREIREGVDLYSTRSEPHLGRVLGSGWAEVEHWGVWASERVVELKTPAGGDCVGVEALLFLPEGGDRELAIEDSRVRIDGIGGPTEVRLLRVFSEGLVEGSRVTIDIGQYRAAAVEIVFYRDRRAMSPAGRQSECVRID